MYSIIDIETTGGNFKKDKITEIAIYNYNGEEITESYSTLINPERHVPFFITRITGITDDDVKDAPKFYEVAEKIIKLTENKIFVAHNSSFDYNFIKEEFAQLGYQYKRKCLCTVRLSRKLLPEMRKYSLGIICEELGIIISDRHRAAGDAEATVKLFKHLLSVDSTNTLFEDGSNQKKENVIGLEKLPESPGIYYLKNRDDKIIYIGKSKNIRHRVHSHLNNRESKRSLEMASTITKVDYEETGNELVALLLEAHEIKKYKPKFNKALRRISYPVGIFVKEDDAGYLNLNIEKNTGKIKPIFAFSNTVKARDYLFRIIEEYKLCQKLCGLYRSEGSCFQYKISMCNGACIGKEPVYEYNDRINKIINTADLGEMNTIIVEKGRKRGELAAVRIENGKFIGFGYIDQQYANNREALKDCINLRNGTRDDTSIIISYLRNNDGYKIINFE